MSWAPTGVPVRAPATPRTCRSTAARSASPSDGRPRGASETVTATAVFKGGETCSLRVSSDWPPPAIIRAGGGRPRDPRSVLPPLADDVHAAGVAAEHQAPPAGARAHPCDDRLPGVPTRRLQLTGICGNGPLSYSKAGRRWSFRVPLETAASIGTCHDIKLHGHLRRTRRATRRESRVRVRPAPSRLRPGSRVLSPSRLLVRGPNDGPRPRSRNVATRSTAPTADQFRAPHEER